MALVPDQAFVLMLREGCRTGGGIKVRRRAPDTRAALDHKPEFYYDPAVKLFYTGPVINAEMLVAMLEKHGINATQEFVDQSEADVGDLSRPANVFVPEADYDRAYQLFYAEREDEL